MRDRGRVFGENLFRLMLKQNVTPQELADKLGYQENDIRKIFDARLFTTTKERNEIAKELNSSVEELYDAGIMECADDRGYIEYRGSFSNEENKDKILDLLDAYCDIQELLIEEGVKPSC